MSDPRHLRRLAVACLVALPLAAAAHGDEDHRPASSSPSAASTAPGAAGASGAAAASAPMPAAGASVPRFAAQSDAFELVGALSGRRLTLWLDRFADNAPVVGARIELEVGEAKLVARADGDAYLAELPAAPTPGTLPITATVTAGDAVDLLAAELVVPAAAAADASPGGARHDARSAGADGQGTDARGLDRRLVGASLASALIAGALGWWAARRRPSRRDSEGERT